jgi:hypothetical protein
MTKSETTGAAGEPTEVTDKELDVVTGGHVGGVAFSIGVPTAHGAVGGRSKYEDMTTNLGAGMTRG